MAFDGPGPFDGDPAVFLQSELEEAPEDAEAIIEEALCTVLEQEYIEVDEGVCAWIAAELLAHLSGQPGEAPLPSPFDQVKVNDVKDLAPLARETLAAVADLERSELAQLWAEGYEITLAARLEELDQRLTRCTA